VPPDNNSPVQKVDTSVSNVAGASDNLEPRPLDPNKPASASPIVNLGFGYQNAPLIAEIAPSPYSQIGISGIAQASGYILEEKLRELQGQGVNSRSLITFEEMRDNDPTCSAVFFILEMMVRKVDWRIEPVSENPDDMEAAAFLESCLEDMDNCTWEDVICDIISMFQYGFSALEIIYKRRLGPDQKEKENRSAYDDGLIGWRKLAGRAQTSLQNWVFDSEGEVLGFWQWPPLSGNRVFLPREKMMFFRTTKIKDNPAGRSLLRGAFTSYYHKINLERIEAIGIERDLAGLPLLYVDPDLLAVDATEDQRAVLAMYEKILKNVKVDQQACLIFPSIFAEGGGENRVYEFQLVSTGSRRQNNTDGIIKRYSQAIATVITADFILLGHEAVGSFALAEQKYDMFNIALGGFLDSIASVFNRDGIRKLFEINGFPTDRLPKLVPGELEKQSLSELSLSLMQLTNAGWLVPGGLADENFIRKVAGMPERMEIPPTPDAFQDDPTEQDYLAHPAYDQEILPVNTGQPAPKQSSNNGPPNPVGQSQGSGSTPTGGSMAKRKMVMPRVVYRDKK
jgi:hypothetical protein